MNWNTLCSSSNHWFWAFPPQNRFAQPVRQSSPHEDRRWVGIPWGNSSWQADQRRTRLISQLWDEKGEDILMEVLVIVIEKRFWAFLGSAACATLGTSHMVPVGVSAYVHTTSKSGPNPTFLWSICDFFMAGWTTQNQSFFKIQTRPISYVVLDRICTCCFAVWPQSNQSCRISSDFSVIPLR